MKILILGGTGAIGKQVVDILSQDQDKLVYVTSRATHENTNQIQYLKGNARDEAFLLGILENSFDAIIDFMSYTTEEFSRRIDKLLSATKQYIFMSSSRVYSNDYPIRNNSLRLLDTCKDDEYLKTDEYALTKARQEDFLKESNSTNWTIVRPYITYSQDRLQLGILEKEEWLYRLLHGRTVVLPEPMMKKKTTLTSGQDVARFIVSITGASDALAKTFHVTTNNSCTWEDVWSIYSDTIQKELGIKPRVKYLTTEKFCKCIQEPRKYQLLYDRFYDRVFDNSEIDSFIDINKFAPPQPRAITMPL